MKTQAGKKMAAVAAVTGIVASVGIATAPTASADQTWPQGCSMGTDALNPWDTSFFGYCGKNTKFKGKEKTWKAKPVRTGSGKIAGTGFRYKLAAKGKAKGNSGTASGYRLKTKLTGKLGKRKIAGTDSFRLSKHGSKRVALHKGSFRYKGKKYKFTVRNNLNNHYWFESSKVALKRGKKTIKANSKLRTYVVVAFTEKQEGIPV